MPRVLRLRWCLPSRVPAVGALAAVVALVCVVACFVAVVVIAPHGERAGSAAAEPSGPRAPLWPVVCPPHGYRQSAHSHRIDVNLSAVGLEPAFDLVADPGHRMLSVVGVHGRADRHRFVVNLAQVFWCIFEGDQVTLVDKLGPMDSETHIYVRTCPIPEGAQRRLDDGHDVNVTFARVYVDAASPWTTTPTYAVHPHPARCPADVRQRLNMPADVPRFLPDRLLPGDDAHGDDGRRRQSRTHVHTLVACTMVNNADSDLIEWLEFHLLQGFDHFYIYYNHRDDDGGAAQPPAVQRLHWHAADQVAVTETVDFGAQASAELAAAAAAAAEAAKRPDRTATAAEFERWLRPYVAAERATVVDWPWPTDKAVQPHLTNDWILQQIAANNHCLNKFGPLTEWMAIFDKDEFMLPMRANHTVLDIMAAVPKQDYESHYTVRMWYYRNQSDVPGALAEADSEGPAGPAAAHPPLARASPLKTQTWVYRETDRHKAEGRDKVIFRPNEIGTHTIHIITSPKWWPHYFDPVTELRLCHYKARFFANQSELVFDDAMRRYGQDLQHSIDRFYQSSGSPASASVRHAY